MALPLFPPERDPGPDFVGLLKLTTDRASLAARGEGSVAVSAGAAGTPLAATVAHGTTVVALRFADGVVMAGDRRATAGNIIAHHAMDKVFPADRFSAVAIAGTAGMAMEMVRLFQVQLEHYEKVEGSTLSAPVGRSFVRRRRPTKSGPGSRSGGKSGRATGGYCPPFCT